MSLDNNTQAARVFWRLVQDFVANVKPWDPAIYYDVKPDERWDATLISQRVYGRRDEFMAVLAAAGVDSVDLPIEQRRIVLPTDPQLRQLKFQAGFESRQQYRNGNGPSWRVN
ncbi:hypothetical protein PU634_05105 [Oceanimonas pelagia]|uniref:Uncharacterized protein n=1 Tax=Oceanimonas pelagia TaxID=3028314 RepID=A0AA50KP15_9GAMM|nr:hypothetical protein [Oceanimonas pelagia]WMC11746.1 hypothetical protein PU634_05105 [Oceanimonas pelagia]